MNRWRSSLLCLEIALLCGGAVGCSYPTAPRQAPTAELGPAAGVPPKVEEARLIQAVENNPRIPAKMKPGIVKSIKSQYGQTPAARASSVSKQPFRRRPTRDGRRR